MNSTITSRRLALIRTVAISELVVAVVLGWGFFWSWAWSAFAFGEMTMELERAGIIDTASFKQWQTDQGSESDETIIEYIDQGYSTRVRFFGLALVVGMAASAVLTFCLTLNTAPAHNIPTHDSAI